jgi:hypothetical protein
MRPFQPRLEQWLYRQKRKNKQRGLGGPRIY